MREENHLIEDALEGLRPLESESGDKVPVDEGALHFDSMLIQEAERAAKEKDGFYENHCQSYLKARIAYTYQAKNSPDAQ